MKRCFTVVLVLFVLGGLSACAKGETPALPADQSALSQSAGTMAAATMVGLAPDSAPTALIEPEASGPTSDELIGEALANGTIDEISALKYKVFAQFKDPRLPAEYSGSVDVNTDSHILDQLQIRFNTLSSEDQALMLPFLVPPVYKGSWGDPAFVRYAPSEGESSGEQYKPDNGTPFPNRLPCDYLDQDNWESTTAMHAPVRFWWLKSRSEDAAVVARLITAMDDDIWPKLTGLLDRLPKSDEGYACNGGSSEVDVYVTAEVNRSYAAPVDLYSCSDVPSYIVLNPNRPDDTLAHEFMHVIQYGYPVSAACTNYDWLCEATAVWSQDYIFPNSNREHDLPEYFFEPAGEAGAAPNLELRNDSHEYGAYLFFFYLTRSIDQPEVIKNAWDNTLSMDSLDAVDKAIPGGFDAVWSDFAVKNMDEPPFDEYQRWDALNIKPSGRSLTTTNGNLGYYNLPPSIDHLSIDYQWFKFDNESRMVIFFNGMTYKLEDEPIDLMLGVTEINDGTKMFKFTPRSDEDAAAVKVQAYYRLEGEVDWILEDWTDRPYATFCRDAKSERLSELVIIFSNSAKEGVFKSSGKYGSALQVSDFGCWRYTGNASYNLQEEIEGITFTDQQNASEVVFERTEAHPNISYPYIQFKVVSGQWSRTYDLQSDDNECSGHGELSAPLMGGPLYDDMNDLYLIYGAFEGPSVMRYTGSALPPENLQIDFACGENEPSQPEPLTWYSTDALSWVLEKNYILGPGGIMEGEDNLLEGVWGADVLYKWSFVPLREP